MKLLTILKIALCCVSLLTVAQAQEKFTERTFKLIAGAKSPPATLNDIKWLSGHWTGRAFGGTAEEIWSDAKAGSMMGMYRLIQAEKPVFYELLTIVEEHGSLVLRLKHFNPDLTGWEEKNTTFDFPLVALGDGAVHFEGISFHPDGDAMTVYLAIEQKGRKVHEEVFSYIRVLPTTK